MRGIFGLVGVLVALGVVIVIMKSFYLPQTQNALEVRDKASKQVEQFGGIDPDTNKDILTTYAVTARNGRNGKIDCLQVDRVDAGGAMQTYFGLQQGDLILQGIAQGVTHDCNEYDNPRDAELWVVREAYTTKGQLIIRRGNSFLVLPGGTPAPNLGNRGAAAQPPPTAPPATQNPPQADPNEHKDQPTESDPLGDINRRLHPTGGM